MVKNSTKGVLRVEVEFPKKAKGIIRAENKTPISCKKLGCESKKFSFYNKNKW